MQRIKLGKPYDDFIQSQIDAGFYGTATEVIRDSLRAKMSEAEQNRIDHIHALIDEAELSVKVDGPIEYKPGTLKKLFNQAKKMSKDKSIFSTHIHP